MTKRVPKKGASACEPMVMEAIRCLDLLVRLASTEQLSEILRDVLPPVQGAAGDMESYEDPTLTLAPGEQRPAETIHARMAHFEGLALKLVAAEFYKEAEALTAITWAVATTLPPALATTHSKWAMYVCKQHRVRASLSRLDWRGAVRCASPRRRCFFCLPVTAVGPCSRLRTRGW